MSALSVPLWRQLSRYACCGGLATATHLAAMALLVAGGMPALWATGLGAALGAAANYFLQYHLAFQSRRAHAQAVLAYLPATAAGWGLNALLFHLLHTRLGASVAPAQLATTLLVALSNFWLYKKAVFR